MVCGEDRGVSLSFWKLDFGYGIQSYAKLALYEVRFIWNSTIESDFMENKLGTQMALYDMKTSAKRVMKWL